MITHLSKKTSRRWPTGCLLILWVATSAQAQLIFNERVSCSSPVRHALDVSRWKTGTYLYQVTTREGTIIGKIIKVP